MWLTFFFKKKKFQNLLRDSLVMSEKNFEKWNWDVIYELAEGPFLNPKRFEEAINSKWLKKLFTFYHPTSRQFCDCKKVFFFLSFFFFHLLNILTIKRDNQMSNMFELEFNL